MLNKLQKILIFIGFLLINPNFCNAYDFGPDDFGSDADSSVSSNFLSGDLGLDLYKKIEKGYTKLQFKLYENELKGGEAEGTIIKALNNQMLLSYGFECFEDNAKISSEDLNNLQNDITVMLKDEYLKDECHIGKGKSFGLSLSTVEEMVTLLNDFNKRAKEKANIKAKKMYDIARIGLYSDGNTDNSPFDLVDDLKKIDEIIFTQDIPYSGVNMNDSDSSLSDLLSGDDSNNIEELENGTSGSGNTQYTGGDNQPDLAEILGTNDPNNLNKICQTNNSGLSSASLDGLGIATGDLNGCSSEGKKGINACCEGLKQSTVNGQKYCIDNSKGATIKCIYKKTEQEGYYYMDGVKPGELIDKVNCSKFDFEQNSDIGGGAGGGIGGGGDWPCDTFFCITIEFITSQHSLLGGGKTKSIESIIARSNKHLKKNTSTSMIQAKKTTNNLEIMLRDLDLAEKFNIGVNLSWKSPPILNLQKKERDTPAKIKKYIEDMLDIAYKENGLDYDRANDLQIFGKVEEMQYCLNNKGELAIKGSNDCQQVKNKDYGTKLSKKIREMRNPVKYVYEKTNAMFDSQIQGLTSAKFYDQYIQVNSFIDYLAHGYSPSVKSYINSMFNDIPVGGD